MGKMITQVCIRFSRYFPGYEVDGATLQIELQEGADIARDVDVLRDVPWNSFVFEDGFEVQCEKSDVTDNADARFDAAFKYIGEQTAGLNKRKV
jgi:hypothetical protein